MSCLPANFLVGFLTGLSFMVLGVALTGSGPTGLVWVSLAGFVGAAVAWRSVGRKSAEWQLHQSGLAVAPELASSDVLDQLRDDFLATLSHELRTPLNAMVGWVHLLRIHAPVDPERGFDAIERNAAQQAQLIDDLLDVSRMLKGGLVLAAQPIDFDQAARAAVNGMKASAAAKHITLVYRAAPGTSVVHADGDRLQQAIRNLVSNAVKFTPEGGRVDITVMRADAQVRLEVRDFGQGVDPSFLPHMFKLFRQGPSTGVRAGLGLGLSIVEAIVQRHGGDVWAESAGRGQGTSLTMALPLFDHATHAAPPSARPEPPTPSAIEARRVPVIRSTGPAAEVGEDRPESGPLAADLAAVALRAQDLPPAAPEAWARREGVPPARRSWCPSSATSSRPLAG
ncbi:MAG: ATP-binding protein [Vicinamibacterales bacterium]